MQSPPYLLQSERKKIMSTIDHDNSFTSKPRHTVPIAGRNEDSHMEVEMSIDSNSQVYKKNAGGRNA